MKIIETQIIGVYIVGTIPYRDHRGAFSRLFCEDELAPILDGRHIVQINHSRTLRVGAVRGMHFQKAPHAEMKLVRCIVGRVWDVAVDLRHGSSTFLQWYAHELDADAMNMMIIPEGCAHGFQVLESSSELIYLHTASYEKLAEGGIRFDDPAIGIGWPLPCADVSPRDQSHALLNEKFKGLMV